MLMAHIIGLCHWHTWRTLGGTFSTLLSPHQLELGHSLLHPLTHTFQCICHFSAPHRLLPHAVHDLQRLSEA